LEPRPGYDYSWAELSKTVSLAKQKSLQVVLFPQLTFPKGAADYWSSARRDAGWWITWYENYHRYLMQVVDWANANSVDGIIVGDPSLAGTFTGGKLADGSQSKAPDNADDQWRQLISDIRAEYSGAVIGAMAYPSSQGFEPSWLDSVDAIYVLYSPTLSQVSSISVDDLMRIVKKDLEESLYPQISKYGKTVILGVNYPSSVNAFIGCTDTLGSCMNDWSMPQVDLGVQSQIYNAAVIVAGKESWISGFISRNYQAVVSVQDSSTSTNGKPAFDVLWFWYHYLLNIPT
jgi:hypothetical protein